MDPLAAGVLGALGGGLTEYGNILKDNRKFKIDQIKANANAARQENLMRAQQMYKDVAVDPTTGMSVTRGEYEQMSPEQRSALQGPQQIREQEATTQFERQRQLKQMDISAQQQRQAQSNAAAMQRMKLTQQMQADTKMKQEIARKSRESKKAEAKQSAYEDKQMAAVEKQISTSIMKVSNQYNTGELPDITGNKGQDIAAYKQVTAFQGYEALANVNKEKADRLLESSPTMKRARNINAILMDAMQKPDPIAYIKTGLKGNDKTIREVLNYAAASGYATYEKPSNYRLKRDPYAGYQF